MKRLLMVLALFVTALGMSGCGYNKIQAEEKDAMRQIEATVGAFWSLHSNPRSASRARKAMRLRIASTALLRATRASSAPISRTRWRLGHQLRDQLARPDWRDVLDDLVELDFFVLEDQVRLIDSNHWLVGWNRHNAQLVGAHEFGGLGLGGTGHTGELAVEAEVVLQDRKSVV